MIFQNYLIPKIDIVSSIVSSETKKILDLHPLTTCLILSDEAKREAGNKSEEPLMKAPMKGSIPTAKIALFISIVILCSCLPDAKRDNPFDPESGPIEGGILSGRVIKLVPPVVGIAGVTVTLSTPGGSGVSGIDGYYTITNIPDGLYNVTASKPDYAEEDTTVDIAAGKSYTINFSLDGLPSFLATSVISEHKKTPSDDFHFRFEAEVNDPDDIPDNSDIASVVVSVDAFSFQKKLNRVLNTNRYLITATPKEVTGGSLEALVGKKAVFSAWDRIGNKTDSAPAHLVRIIHPSPSIITPNEEERMDSRRLLIWESFSDVVDFDFTYTVDVISFSSGWQWEDISPDSTALTVTESLNPHLPYQWAVWVVDEYGNTSKSPYVTFYVEGGR